MKKPRLVGESQRRDGELAACLNWVYNLSSTAGGHFKEEGGQAPIDAAHNISCLYGKMRRNRGISLPNGNQTA